MAILPSFLQILHRQQGLFSLTSVTSLPSFQTADVLVRFPLPPATGLAISFASIYSLPSWLKCIRPSSDID
jgi:hypothetical protein